MQTIGEHPFVTVAQLRRMQSVSRSHVYARLRGWETEGLIASVNPREPTIRARSFYYLKPRGARRLGLPRRRGRPRFLERLGTVYEVRNLFISAQRAGVSILRWQALTPAVRGVSLHGVAQTVGGRQMIVEWDRGERPTRLVGQRLERVARVAAEAEAGLLIVAADEQRGATILGTLGGHLDPRGPDVGVTTRQVLGAQGLPSAPCFIPAVSSTMSLGGFVKTLPPGQEHGERLISTGVLSFRGEWEGNTRLVVALSPLQKMLLSLLAGVPLVTAKELSVLSGGHNVSWVERALTDLRSRVLVREYEPDANLLCRYYYITKAGLSFLSGCCGAPVGAYARARGWALRNGEVSISHLVRAFDHTREAREVVIALAEEARRQDRPLKWYDELEAHVYFRAGGSREVLAPDARVRWGTDVMFVEIDRATSGFGREAEKLRTYYRFRASAEHRRFGDGFKLLVVAPETSRERRWLEETSRLAGAYGVEPLDVRTTTREAVQRRGVGAPIWRTPGDVTRRRRL